MEVYELIMFWDSFYPHTIGDEILRDIIDEQKDGSEKS